MIRCSVMISLVEEARGGPFVFWHDLAAACERAAALGFHGVEVFAPDASAVDAAALAGMLERHGLALAAVGTGGGWVRRKLTLTSADPSVRAQAVGFARDIVTLGAEFGAPAIIGSLQGRSGGDVTVEQARAWLREGLDELAGHASSLGVPLLFEPLNRYEGDLASTLADGVQLVESLSVGGVKLLADLFHMNIEEADSAAALRVAAGHVGHVHFADSNRRAAGLGQTDFKPLVAALQESGYSGYLSAEVFPLPDPEAAAAQTMTAYRALCGGS